jgi:TatD DNase family protein
MGLDYYYDFSPRPVQQDVFVRQLRLARQLGLPIVIHCRDAHVDVVRILLDEGYAGRRVVFHCFSGNCDEAAELRSHGWRASFTGIVTFGKSLEMQRVCAATPRDEIMFETDSPYLSPEPVRRMRPNEPANLVHTVRFAAELRSESFETLAAVGTANANRFFGLGE